jgi:hypothetical protein
MPVDQGTGFGAMVEPKTRQGLSAAVGQTASSRHGEIKLRPETGQEFSASRQISEPRRVILARVAAVALV